MGGLVRRHMALLASACIALSLLVFVAPPAAAAPPKPPAPVSVPSLHGSQPPLIHGANLHDQKQLPPFAPRAPGVATSWNWQNPSPNANSLYSISCPTTTTCFAVGEAGPILRTADGGANWTQVVQAATLFSISCPTTSNCVAVGPGALVMVTADGGTTWTTKSLGSFDLDSVSCPTAMICDTVGGGGFRTTDGGATWNTDNIPATHALYAVSCPDIQTCVVVGDQGTYYATVTGGATWPGGGSFGTGFALTAVSCSDSNHCVAVGTGGVYAELFPGPNGTGANGPLSAGQVSLSGVSCRVIQRCLATGIDGNVYIESPQANGSAAWGVASTVENGFLYSISCPTRTVCFADGDLGLVVTTGDGGTAWSQQSPGFGGSLLGVNCPSTTTCFAVGSDGTIMATTDGGKSWPYQNSGTFSHLEAVSCPSTSNCFAVGDNGVIIATTNGGSSWVAQSSGTTSGLGGISCPSTTTCYVTGIPGILGTTDSGGHWTLLKSATVSAISCPTTTTCFALAGGSDLLTTDGGVNWTSQLITTTNPYTNAISCGSTSDCMVAGEGEVLVTSNGGSSWTNVTPGAPYNSYFYTTVSCPAPTTCYVVQTGVLSTTDLGTTWTARSFSSSASLFKVSCPSTTICYAVGSSGTIAKTTDGNALAWPLQAPSGTTNNLVSVSCPTATVCYALAQNQGLSATTTVMGTTNGGWWAPLFTTINGVLISLTCPTTLVCFAIGILSDQLLVTTDGWASANRRFVSSDPNFHFYSISCSTTTFCLAAGPLGYTYRTTEAWATWSSSLVTQYGLSAMSCPTTSKCFATDSGSPSRIYASGDGGLTWALSFDLSTDRQALGATGPFSVISCPTTTNCYAAGGGGVIAATSDGGAHWHVDNPVTLAGVVGISCGTATTCGAVTYNSGVLYTSNSGSTWDIEYVSPSATLVGISCPGVATCFAVGMNGVIVGTTKAGSDWKQLAPKGATGEVRGIACAGASVCYATAIDSIVATKDGGVTWTPHSLNPSDVIIGMTCTGISTCFAVGWPGALYSTFDGGTTWTYRSTSISGADETLTDVGCLGPTTCVAVGTDGIALSTTDGINWYVESTPTSANLLGISCSQGSFCVAVGGGGIALTRAGGSWQAHTAASVSLTRVSCTGGATCYAVGLSGTIVMSSNAGASWTAQTSGTTFVLLGIACARPGVCVAVGSGGTALLTMDGVSWIARSTPTFDTILGVAFPDPNHVWIGGVGGALLGNTNITQFCSSASIAPNALSPQSPGGTITFSATSTTCSSPQYQFYLQAPGGSWSAQTSFGGSTWSWSTAGLAPGVYGVGVWARQTGSSAGYDGYWVGTYTLLVPPCTAASLTTATAPPQLAGAAITYTATATGCSGAQFRFWLRSPNGTWTMQRDYGAGSWTWNTTGLANGTYQVGVWARQAGSTAAYEAYGFNTFVIGAGTCNSAGLTPSLSPPQAPGATVQFTATSNSCSSASYQFWLLPPGGSWTVMQPYSATTAWNWNTSGYAPGTYQVGVWAKASGSANSYDAYFIGTYQIDIGACSAAGISASPSSPQAPGTSITFTAIATGCSDARYEFWELPPPGSTWNSPQPYGTATTFVWNSTGASGPYRFGVWVRQNGSATSYDSYAIITLWVGS